MFSLTRDEIMRISQIVISSAVHDTETLKFSKSVMVFTEQGVAMLSGILKKPKGGTGKYSHNAGLCPSQGDAGLQQRIGKEAGRNGEEV